MVKCIGINDQAKSELLVSYAIIIKDARVMPRQHCLNTVVINENWEYPNTEIFKDISIYLKKRNIKSCGIATATYPNYYFQENGKKVRYAKVKVPIELK